MSALLASAPRVVTHLVGYPPVTAVTRPTRQPLSEALTQKEVSERLVSSLGGGASSLRRLGTRKMSRRKDFLVVSATTEHE